MNGCTLFHCIKYRYFIEINHLSVYSGCITWYRTKQDLVDDNRLIAIKKKINVYKHVRILNSFL